MKKYLYDYIAYMDDYIKKGRIKKEDIENHLIKIRFFQHERLIHLIVTLFFSFLFMIFLFLIALHYVFAIVAFIFMIFVLCYIVHYYHLENGVQYLYKQYDELKK